MASERDDERLKMMKGTPQGVPMHFMALQGPINRLTAAVTRNKNGNKIALQGIPLVEGVHSLKVATPLL